MKIIEKIYDPKIGRKISWHQTTAYKLGDYGKNFDRWTLYKSADFKAHWAKLESEDIARWEQWLNSDHIVDANEMV
jgi:hypothetical protein